MGPADDALVVQLELANFSGTMAQLNQFARAVGNLGNAGGTGGGVQGHGRNIQQHVIGPWGRSIAAVQKYYDAVKRGNKVEIADAKMAMDKAEAAYRKAYGVDQNGKSQAGVVGPGGQGDWWKKLQNLVYSSRFGGVNGSGLSVQPLIGRTLQFLASLGPFGRGLAIAGGAALTLAAAAEHAASALSSVRTAQLVTGSKYAQTAFSEALSRALKQEPGAAAGAAEQFAQTLGSSPWAMQFWGGRGVRDPLGGTPFGNKNQMKQFIDALDKFRQMSEDEALQAMRSTPELKQFAQVRDLSAGVWLALKAQGAAEANAFKDSAKLAANFNAELEILGSATRNAATGLGAGAMRLGRAGMDRVLGMDTFEAAAKKREDDKKAQESHVRALNRNTDAIEDQIRATYGISGGGDRARGAMPSHLRGLAFDQGLRAQAIKLGAFSL